MGERCDVTTLAIQAFLNRKAKEGLSWCTRKALQAVTGAVFAKAETWNYWSGTKSNQVRHDRQEASPAGTSHPL